MNTVEDLEMIEIIPLDGSQTICFENYDQLFDHIVEVENRKFVAKQQDNEQINWNFTIYSTKQVAVLYVYHKDPDDALKEAYEEGLSLIEICTGSYAHPNYIVMTPNIDMDYLKRKWCLDFCTYCNWVVYEIGML